MARSKNSAPPPIEPRVFRTVEDVEFAIKKIKRRIIDLEQLDLREAVLSHNGSDKALTDNIQETIREVFGSNSPEFRKHGDMQFWIHAPSISSLMDDEDIADQYVLARKNIVGILNGLVSRLEEQREDLGGGASPPPSSNFDRLNLHPRITDVSRDLFMDSHHWEAVFAASKALVNYVKERSGRHELDGAPLMRTVFSRSSPVLAFNDLKTPTDEGEQEGFMHLFEGAVLGIRNPGGHAFPTGTAERALEYISLLSLLAYLTQEAKKRQPSK